MASLHVVPDPPPTEKRAADCGDPADGGYRPATEAQFRTAVARVWLLCQAPSFFGGREAGVEINADGTWSKLEWKANGTLVRAAGRGNEGAWRAVDTSAMNGTPTYQIDFDVDGGLASATPVFGAGRSKVRLDNMGVFVADYIPAPPGTSIS